MQYRTAMLRFGDAETSDRESDGTVARHKRIIEANGSTWWGWWKKETEPFQRNLLNYLREEARGQHAIEVGLFSRKENVKVYVARCIDVEFAIGGTELPSPDKDLTPDYYGGEPFPAWFKFARIDEISRYDFERRFHEIPSLDPTLYDVVRDDSQWTIYPRPAWSMNPIDITDPTILHLSDLHFGADHGYPTERPLPGSGIDWAPLWQLIASHLRDKRIGLVVVSGDLITRGDGNFFPAVREFIDRLLNALRLDTRHLVIVPGNHDLWTQNVAHPTRRYAHQQPYADFIQALFRSEYPSDEEFSGLERVRRYRAPNGDDLIFIELNSARIRSDDFKEYGYVSKHRYEDLLRFVDESLEQNPSPTKRAIRFAVLHHHILPVGGVAIPEKERAVSLCLDAGELIHNFQEHGVQFVLHGHQHAPFVGMTAQAPAALGNDRPWQPDRRSLYVLSCGSSGVKRERLPNDVNGNSFGFYRVEGDRMALEFTRYLPGVEPTTFWSTVLPIPSGRRRTRTGGRRR